MVAVYYMYVGKSLGKKFHAAIVGVVVYHIYLRLNALYCFFQRQQALLGVEFHLIANYYNGKFQLLFIFR